MLPLPFFMVLSALMMFSFGMMVANFTALAMEPQGHIAGTASSLYGSITTLIGIGVGMAIGQTFDGTMLPFTAGAFLSTLAALCDRAGGGTGAAVRAASYRGVARPRRRASAADEGVAANAAMFDQT